LRQTGATLANELAGQQKSIDAIAENCLGVARTRTTSS